MRECYSIGVSPKTGTYIYITGRTAKMRPSEKGPQVSKNRSWFAFIVLEPRISSKVGPRSLQQITARQND